ncbi:hypothetical protein PTW37_06610 [Arthrobacter agilis]|uniref:hypothetical protein n=1 Tax=Arthrobacter agilis TaxID=37921 RepID=UPI0023670090|nr:hypothetical protein [Arthrobacter agilis]WDF34566.1 hypothetical protein PTW37_06610 [Arthrobacter agilis]
MHDPRLWIWQSLCDIYDQIDDLMVTADNAEQRKLLATLIAQEAPHFATWREESSTDRCPS